MAIKSGLTEQEAQDVVQETLISVAKSIKDFRVGAEHGSFKSWLLKMTRWRIADQFRKRKPDVYPPPGAADQGRSSETAEIERAPDPASLDLELAWEKEWRQTVLEVALERVRDKTQPAYYQMFDLHVVKGWPAQEAARALKASTGQVYFAKYKVARLIKKEVKRLEAELF